MLIFSTASFAESPPRAAVSEAFVAAEAASSALLATCFTERSMLRISLIISSTLRACTSVDFAMFCTVVDVSSVIEFICSVAAERFCAEKLTLSAVVLIILMMPAMFEKSSFSAKPSLPSSSSDLMSTVVVRSPALFASARLAVRSWAMGRFSTTCDEHAEERRSRRAA